MECSLDHSGKILIVDDSPVMVKLMACILEPTGLRPVFAEDGETALSLASSEKFDLILLDIMLPGIDGFEVCERLQKNPRTSDTPVLFLTAKNETECIVRGFETGAVDYVTKPVNDAELLARVKTHLELHRIRQELKFLAEHDDLTGLYNTRYLYRSLPELIKSRSSDLTPFSLIFMDIDDFKTVVDTYGHLNGSRALQEVAATICRSLNKPAYGVAYGGDEFVIVLPGYDKIQAISKAESIRFNMGRTVYLSEAGYEVSIRASYGVATYPDDALNMSGLLALADQAMFSIKDKGKDAVGDCRKLSRN